MIKTGDASRSALMAEHYFALPCYLSATGRNHILTVTHPGDAASDPLVFHKDSCWMHLDRLKTLTAYEIETASSEIFRASGASFCGFDDILLPKAEVDKLTLPHLAFTYQSNWVIDLATSQLDLSRKMRSNYRYKYRKLSEQLGYEPQQIFRKCNQEDLQLLLQYIQRRHSSGLAGWLKPKNDYANLKNSCEQIGFFSALYDREQFISGNLIYIVNDKAYGVITTFNPEFAPFSPGLLGLIKTMERLQKQGIKELHLLWGDNPYKKSLGAKQQALTTLFVMSSWAAFLNPHFIKCAAPYYLKSKKKQLAKMIGR